MEQFRYFSSAVSFSVKNFYPSPYELNSSIIQEIINPQNDSTANFNLISYRDNSQKKWINRKLYELPFVIKTGRMYIIL